MSPTRATSSWTARCPATPTCRPSTSQLKQLPGVVEHGLFIGLAERALLGRPDGSVEVLER